MLWVTTLPSIHHYTNVIQTLIVYLLQIFYFYITYNVTINVRMKTITQTDKVTVEPNVKLLISLIRT